MASVKLNSIVKGMSGSIGNLVIRQYKGRTIISGQPRKPKKQTELQRQSRSRFKQAAYAAKVTLRDPEKKAYYAKKAEKNNQPNAYTAALQEFLQKLNPANKGSKVSTTRDEQTKWKRQSSTTKNANLEVLMHDGAILEKVRARATSDGGFTFKLKKAHLAKKPITIKVSIND